MATFGHTGDGNSVVGPSAGYITASKFTLAEAGNVTKLFVRGNYNVDPGNTQCAIYTNGSPRVRMAYTGSGALPPSNPGWVELPVIDGPIALEAGDYWLCRNGDVADIKVCVQSGSNYCQYASGTYGTWPSSIATASFSDWTLNDVCIYAEYIPSGGGDQNVCDCIM